MKAKRPGKLRAALLGWLGVPIDLINADFWSDYAAHIGARAAGQTVNESTVLSLSAAWACTRLISESIGTLPLRLYERTPEGRRPAVDHPLYRILHTAPNIDSTAVQYWESKSAAMILRGNGFSRKQMVGGRLVGLKFLAPARLSVHRNTRGLYEFRYVQDNGTQIEIPEREIWRVPGFSLDGKWGVSAIAYGAQVFGSALAANAAANSTFEKGLMPTTYYKYPKILKADQRAEARTAIKTISGAVNAGDPAILEADMEVGTIGINPTDAQLLQSREWSIEEVCRWFMTDPSMVGYGGKDSNFGTGLEQKLIRFLTFTLRAWLTRIEQSINKDLLAPQDRGRYYAEFGIEGLLRADSAARAAFYSVMVNNGIMTRDEVRDLENWAQMGGNAGVLTVQSAMIPLDRIGAQTDGDTARAALAAWLKEGNHETARNS
jgi:HK97 family phage portal protein